MIKKYKPLFEVFFLSIIAFLIHKILFFSIGNPNSEKTFHYSLNTLYIFFSIFSLFIVGILTIVKEKNIDNVGNTYLLVTLIKMGISYILLYPILQGTKTFMTTEKTNFIIVFLVFLTIETVVTIRILNKKQ